jgi:hypothetical protein
MAPWNSVELIEMKHHINDATFSDAAARRLLDLLGK